MKSNRQARHILGLDLSLIHI
ncbi:ribosome hibernation factor SRA [Escherichia coli]